MIAITGAAGFIGSNLAHRLAEDGQELLLVDDDLSPEKAKNLARLAGFRFLRHDRFLLGLEAGRVNPTAIFHLGACSSTTETNWAYLAENNIEYPRRLWNWCSWRDRPLIYASSAATYGDGSLGFDDRTAPTDLKPLNLYGKSKNDFDAWVMAEVAAGRPAPPRWAGLKFFNVYGPREQHKGRMASMVWHCYQQIQETGRVRLFRSTDPAFADGGQLRDFVHVSDCVGHMLWLWRHDHPGGLYNSGTGTARSFLALAHAVFRALDRQPVIEFIEMPTDLVKQYQNYTQAIMTKLQSVGCGVLPTPLELGVFETVRFLNGYGHTSPRSVWMTHVEPPRKTA